MSVLVTGATGTVGSVVVPRLVAAGLDVRALTRSPEKATFAPGVTPFKGELLDVDALRAAMDGVEAVFLLSPVVPDELNVTISALNLCRELKERHYASHPVTGAITRQLIWELETPSGEPISALPGPDGLTGADGQPLPALAATRVRLWHPARADAAEVRDWRAAVTGR